MKREWKDVVIAVMMGVLLPGILFNTAALFSNSVSEEPFLESTESTDPPSRDPSVQIRVQMPDDTVETMDLEAYLVGVVLGEMPASFEPEALKAQAVVARTYTLRRKETGTKHSDADVCMDPACCQAYRDGEQYCREGGTQAAVNKVQNAVEATVSMVLTYDGALIEATYFASSGGRTEDALAVWGSDLPYLQATDSPEDAYAEKYMSTVTFTEEEFQDALDRDLPGSCASWFGKATYTNGDGVDTMVIGGKEYEGTELRQLLGLRSTAFTFSVSGSSITITTRGYGHRVGMSQYGAEAMAVEGRTFDEILAHYYQGTVLEEYIDNGLDFE